VQQPTTAQDGVADLHALLNAAKEPGPYILVGASWGGMIAKLYASTYPNDVSGIVFVDAASEFLKTTLTPAQWAGWMQTIKTMAASRDLEVPDYDPSVKEIHAASPVPSVAAVVLTSDKPWDLQVGDSGSTWSAWLAAQDRLATLLNAKHITNTNSGHPIGIEQPQLVVEAIREVLDATRSSKPK
jgi:pimeloyl-ACP methyl ester carboxylesterase